MPSATPYVLSMTRQQGLALQRVGKELEAQIWGLWPDLRHRAPIINVFDNLEDAIDGASTLDEFEVDIEYFVGELFPRIRHPGFQDVIRARARDLISTTIIWRALEDLGNSADTADLLSVPKIDEVDWADEALTLLQDRGCEVVLPRERG